MDKQEELAPEEKEVNSIFKETFQRLEEIDKQIDYLPADKGPEPRPSGMPSSRPLGTKAQMTERLKAESGKLKTEANEKANAIYENSRPEIKEKVADKIKQWNDPNYQENQKKKELSKSQDYLLKLKDKGGPDKLEIQSKNQVQSSERSKPQEPNSMSMSARFSAGYLYNQKQEQPDKGVVKPEKSRETDKDRE